MAMIEAMVSLLGDQAAIAQVTGCEPPRRGNRDARHVPQGVYRCAGDDRWIAISVTSDAEWRALCEAAGLPEGRAEWGCPERHRRHDEIDDALAGWTRSRDPRSLMWELQGRGVIATLVSDARDLVEDPHLAARGFWARLDHPDAGLRTYPGTPIRLSRTPVTYRAAAPTLGQHNDEVFLGLGATREGLAAMRQRGVVVEEPPG
jgi:benzylsuccinate CoA-transferase BbsF subunit